MAARPAAPMQGVQLIAVYARRPKLHLHAHATAMKINADLLCAAAEFWRVGVPVFAAFPRLRSLLDFGEFGLKGLDLSL